jgi:hypothetical protein
MFAPRSTLSRANPGATTYQRSAWTVRLALSAFGVFGISACGASINALYESDVRFEHCMALDDNAKVKQTIRTACWDEWLKFYTFGQTRDRIEYAKLRSRQLRNRDNNGSSELLASTSHPTEAVPEPTTALAPPPMLLVVDAGTADTAEKESDDPTEPPGWECSSNCEGAWGKCKKECVTPMCNRQTCISKCEKTCKEEHATCMRSCFM